MSTLRQIITDALRESNIVGAGLTPEAEEFDEGLRRLQVLIRSLYGTTMGDRLENISFGVNGLTNSFALEDDGSSVISNTYVPSNSRLIFNLSSAQTIYLDPNPDDGARFAVIDNGNTLDTYNVVIHGNGRQIEDVASVTLSTEGLSREWFYRADLGNWARVTDLDADDFSPFPEEFDDYLITLLAFRLNPRYGIDAKGETVAILRQFRTMFRARYRQKKTIPSELALLRTSERVSSLTDLSPEDSFSYGRP